MPIIGKLIKTTNSISYKRNLKKSKDFTSQLNTLKKALRKCKNTSFGTYYKFGEYVNSKQLYSLFQKHVPIQDYDELYEKWLFRTLKGEKDVTWTGRIRHFALSSGTTGSPSKRLPVSFSMIRSFKRVSMSQISTLHQLDLPVDFYQAQILPVGGSTDLVRKENHFEGDLSGILRKYAPIIASPFTKPEKKISKVPDWPTKLKLMVEKAPEWNIGIIAGVPSWCILLMEKIIEYHQVDSIHDVWPNLHVYAHGGVFMDPYIDRLNRVLGRKIHLIDTYLASEGYFAYQTDPNIKSMQLLLDKGIFFEFVPFNGDYFDLEGELIDKHVAFTIDEVQPGMDYAIVVSTNAGLWRYLIGDLVRFTDIERREIVLTGRIKQFLSLCGEHLSLGNINAAIQEVCEAEKIEITEYTLLAKENELQHDWYLGTNNAIDAEKIMQLIDEAICRLNDDYRCSRSINLKKPSVTVLSPTVFYSYLQSKGKSGAQFKFPRVIAKNQREDWMEYVRSL
jgi:hypothetical protein